MAVSFTVYIKKISQEHHEFRYIQASGVGEAIILDTKSYLLHDLIHFVVEKRARLEYSFYGLLAHSGNYEDLSEADLYEDLFGGEICMTERIVVGLTPVLRGDISSEQFLAGARNLIEDYQKKIAILA